MRVLIDTNIIIGELRSGTTLRGLPDRWVPILSVITAMELHALPGTAADEEAAIAAIVTSCIVLPIDQTIATLAGRLKRTRTKRRALDLLIAATAVAYNLPLYTRDTRDFRDIPGLVVMPS